MQRSTIAFIVAGLATAASAGLFFLAQDLRATSDTLSARGDHVHALMTLREATSSERWMLVGGGVLIITLLTGIVLRVSERRRR